MAADAAISYAVQKLGDALLEEVSFLRGIEDKVRWLRDELQNMKCFLKDAEEKQAAGNESVRNWISDVQEAALDAEDAIEIFFLKVDTPRKNRGMLRRFIHLPAHVSHLNRVGVEIESIHTRLQEIERRRQTYGIQKLDECTGPGSVSVSGSGSGSGSGSSSRRKRSEDAEWRRRLPCLPKDEDVVGLKEDVEVLLQKLIMEEKKGLSVAAIVGMGGIGKSTLARKIYEHKEVVTKFECLAWVVVSSEFEPEDVIKKLMLEISSTEDQRLKVLETTKKWEEAMKDKLFIRENLQKMLRKELEGKSYFIVLDDVWEYTHWESLTSAFPDEKDKASRLLFTSRRKQIISQQHGYIHDMRFLEHKESWELLLKMAFLGKTDPGNCPQELQSIGQDILNKCDGLPLAINVAGGLLVNHGESASGWGEVLKEMSTHLDRRANRSGSDTVSAILESSYHNLPSELKACFLCLGFFKEDATIRAKRLIHIWVAQDFFLQDGEEMEEIARGYLVELINRNLVQVKDIGKDNRVRTIQIHDIIRDLSIKMAKEKMGFEILKDKAGNNSQSLRKCRYRAMYCSQERLLDSNNEDKHLRSLVVHVMGKFLIESPSSSYWESFELLKVLDLEGCRLELFPTAIGGLIGLKYLGLRYTRISELPRELGRLVNLLVLDLQWNSMVKVPNVIYKMYSLRHLYVDSISHSSGRRLKIGTLKNIQTLTYVQLADWMMVVQPKEMASLRKLGIVIDSVLDPKGANKLFASLAMLENLCCLNLRMSCALDNMDGLSTLEHITQLKLRGKMTRLPGSFPPNLSLLSLIIYTQLEEDPMPMLEKLPNLSYLKLNYTHLGEKMVITGGGFPKLKVLCLEKMWVLKSIQVGEGAMPELKQLKISNCPYLKAEDLPERLRSAAITGIN